MDKKTVTIEIKNPSGVAKILNDIAGELWDEDHREQLLELNRLIYQQLEGYSEESEFKQLEPFIVTMPRLRVGESKSLYVDSLIRLSRDLIDVGFYSVEQVKSPFGDSSFALELKMYKDAMPFYLNPNETLNVDETHCRVSYAGVTTVRLSLDVREGRYATSE